MKTPLGKKYSKFRIASAQDQVNEPLSEERCLEGVFSLLFKISQREQRKGAICKQEVSTANSEVQDQMRGKRD